METAQRQLRGRSFEFRFPGDFHSELGAGLEALIGAFESPFTLLEALDLLGGERGLVLEVGQHARDTVDLGDLGSDQARDPAHSEKRAGMQTRRGYLWESKLPFGRLGAPRSHPPK